VNDTAAKFLKELINMCGMAGLVMYPEAREMAAIFKIDF
jgi:hypothetical protein